MRNLTTPVRVGLLVVLGLVAFFVYLSFLRTAGMQGPMNEYSAVLEDASGLAPQTPVRVAGIPVGEITRIQLEGGQARIWFTVRADIAVYPNAVLAKRSASILGDYVLDLHPGGPRSEEEGALLRRTRGLRVIPAQARRPMEPLPPGSEIHNVREAVEIEAIFESLDKITGDVEQITGSLREALAGDDNSIQRIIATLDRITERLEGTIADSSDRLEEILANAQAITGDLRSMTEGKGDDVDAIVTNVRLITEQTREILASVQSIVGEGDDMRETVGGVREAVTRLNSSLANLEEITAKIERGEGTVGRLVSDEELAQKLDNALYQGADYVERLTSLQLEVALRSEYLFNEQQSKNYLQLRVIPRPDKWFVLEVIDDPRGVVTHETVFRSPPGAEEVANQEIRITRDTLKFSALFAKRYYFATFKFGLMESTGGVGTELNFLNDHVVVQLDAFDFTNPATDYPRVRARLNLHFLSHLFLSGGGDDLLNPREVEATSGQVLYGRDWFLGGGLYFTDEDLKTLIGGVGNPF